MYIIIYNIHGIDGSKEEKIIYIVSSNYMAVYSLSVSAITIKWVSDWRQYTWHIHTNNIQARTRYRKYDTVYSIPPYIIFSIEF